MCVICVIRVIRVKKNGKFIFSYYFNYYFCPKFYYPQQVSKNFFSVCPDRGKSQKIFLAFAPTVASIKKIFRHLPRPWQVSKKFFGICPDRGKSQKNFFSICHGRGKS